MSDQDPLNPRPDEPFDEDADEYGYDLYDSYEEESERGVLRIVGVLVVLGIVIAALLLPPISLLDRGGEEPAMGISTQARDDLPPLPGSLAARSALYDITTGDEFTGPAALTVRLNEQADAS